LELGNRQQAVRYLQQAEQAKEELADQLEDLSLWQLNLKYELVHEELTRRINE
jgi:hypothetical protein